MGWGRWGVLQDNMCSLVSTEQKKILITQKLTMITCTEKNIRTKLHFDYKMSSISSVGITV